MNRESRKSDYTTLLVERLDNGVLVVTLNRPDEGNAMNTQMCIDLLDLWTGLVRDAGTVRCVIVTGAGERDFCAGGDMKERKGMTEEAWRHQHTIGEQALWTMMECPVPVVVAVNGSAQGGGLEMVLAADFAYGVESARFGFPEVMIGIIPGWAAPRPCHALSVSVAPWRSFSPEIRLALRRHSNGASSTVSAVRQS